jgi:DNA-binding FadR family transcriptional regulator
MLYLHREATQTRMLKDPNAQHHEISGSVPTGDAVRAAEAFMQYVLFGKQRLIDQLEG